MGAIVLSIGGFLRESTLVLYYESRNFTLVRMANFVETETASGFKKLYKNAAVIVLTDRDGVTYNGIIRAPSPQKSLVRYNEGGILKEERIENLRLVPAKAKPKAD